MILPTVYAVPDGLCDALGHLGTKECVVDVHVEVEWEGCVFSHDLKKQRCKKAPTRSRGILPFHNPYKRWSPESNRNSNHTGLGLLASLRPSTICPSFRAVIRCHFKLTSKIRLILLVPVVVSTNRFPVTLIALVNLIFLSNPKGTFTPSTVNVNVWFGLPPLNPELK